MIRFLTVDDINRPHELTISAHGGLPGIRDSGLLEAAAAMPLQIFGGEYLHPGIPAMTAAYLFHICQAHAYVDGNERAAVLAALVLGKINGVEPLPEPEDLENVTLKVASGRLAKSKLTSWFGERFV